MMKYIEKIMHYGDKSDQFGHLFRPLEGNKQPVVIVIHGGYWKDNHSLDSYPTAGLTDFLKTLDVVIWNLEYRRMEFLGKNTTAPWPAVHADIADGIDFLANISSSENLDLSRILIVGHSAGGHLAVWASCREEIPSISILFRPSALKINSVLSIAGILNLSHCEDTDQPEQVLRLMGGNVSEFPERYQACDPYLLKNFSADLSIMHGYKDNCVDISQALSFCENTTKPIEKLFLPEADHFSMLPHAGEWQKDHWTYLKAKIKEKVNALG